MASTLQFLSEGMLRIKNSQQSAYLQAGAFLDILGPGGYSPIWGPFYGVGGEQSEAKQLGA